MDYKLSIILDEDFFYSISYEGFCYLILSLENETLFEILNYLEKSRHSQYFDVKIGLIKSLLKNRDGFFNEIQKSIF